MKKTFMLSALAALVCCSTLFVACKKDETVDPTPAKVKKLLADWKIKTISVPKAGQPTVDSPLLKACMADDVIRFSTAGFDFQDGTNKCDSSIFHYAKGTWAYDLANDSLKMNATNPVKYVSWKIVTINDTLLKVKFIDSISPANKLSKTIEFKK